HNQALITNGENILFTRPNHAPIAAADTATTMENVQVLIHVLTNDFDADGNILSVTSVTQGTNGGTTIIGATYVLYRPITNFSGVDAFIYTISDGQGGFASNTVSVTVTPVNNPPQPGPDFCDTHRNVPLTLKAADLVTNDMDADGDALMVTGVSS